MNRNLDEISEKLQDYSNKVSLYLDDKISGDTNEIWKAAAHYIKAGGKRLRPFLVMKTCEMLGGATGDEIIPAASAFELVHTFTLIHDDIIDGDKTRRGVPTVHEKWNEPMAILAGDILFARAIVLAAELKVKPEIKAELMKSLAEVVIDLCVGQTLDVSFETKENISIVDYLNMIYLKTGALFEKCVYAGAVLSDAGEKETEALKNYGRYLGLAFQIADDILGLVADEKILGKPVLSDIREGKKTFPIICALRNLPQEKSSILSSFLPMKNKSPADIDSAYSLIIEAGVLDISRKSAIEYRDQAVSALSIFAESSAKKDLIDLVYLSVDRVK
jgi:geranylgeranyl diphosphate synthase type I